MMLYFAQRLAAVAGVITLMSVLVFLATHALPATIAEVMLGQYATPETVAALEEAGTNAPATDAVLGVGLRRVAG